MGFLSHVAQSGASRIVYELRRETSVALYTKPILLSALKDGYCPNANEEAERPLIARVALHALRLKLTHPTTGESLTFKAPHAKNFNAMLNQLRKL